jgi:hypothetical protein
VRLVCLSLGVLHGKKRPEPPVKKERLSSSARDQMLRQIVSCFSWKTQDPGGRVQGAARLGDREGFKKKKKKSERKTREKDKNLRARS